MGSAILMAYHCNFIQTHLDIPGFSHLMALILGWNAISIWRGDPRPGLRLE